ncbi:MAG: Alpha/Beta hydrolase protein [Monoraphidium minutum]|nr:MAG: Alpha/Beta hydrolase protein [Monoraphidium minutum]
MNNKGVISDWRIVLALPLFWLIDLILSIRPLARSLFDNVRGRDTLAKVLQGVYCNKDAVDDDLVDIIAAPSEDENALDVFVSVVTGPSGPKPWDLLPQISAPIFIAWGDRDPFTPLDGPVGRFFEGLPDSRPATTFALLEDVGHCPQDDRPELLHARLLPWLAGAFGGASSADSSVSAVSSSDV